MQRLTWTITLALAAILTFPLLSACTATPALPGPAAAKRKGFDNVIWLKPAGTIPGRLYLVLTRSFEPEAGTNGWTFADDRDDLNRHVMRYAQLALDQAQEHPGAEMRIVFFVRYHPDGTIGYSRELTLDEVRQIAAATSSQARHLLYNDKSQWHITRLPSSAEPSVNAAGT